MTRLALILMLLSCPALAQTVDCAQATAQADLTWCAGQDWRAADARLNRAYKEAIAAMRRTDANLAKPDQGAEAALRAAQRAWVTYRDQDCTAEAFAFHGGTAEPMVMDACRARLTRARAQELETMAAAD